MEITIVCSSIPMRVERVEGLVAHCSAKGTERTASLMFMMDDPPEVGEYVLINLGHAVRKISTEEAEETWRVFDQLMGAGDAAT